MWDPYAEFESITLANGLTIHVAHWPKRSWEAVGFLIHSGAENDPVGLEGLAHFVEHTVSENAGIPRKEIEDFFADCGGGASLGSTGYPSTKYGFSAPTTKATIKKAFDIFGGMLLSANIKKAIERERAVIVGEFHRHYPTKIQVDMDILARKAMYANHWLGRFVRPLGTPESILKIGQDDLRSYYDKYYTPANISIVCVGGLSLSKIAEYISQSPFAASKEGQRTPFPGPITDLWTPTSTRHVFTISDFLSMDEKQKVGEYKSIAIIPESINLRAVSLFCEMLNQILFEEIREKRAWAYGVQSLFCNLRQFSELKIRCSGLAVRAIDEVEQVVESCLESLAKNERLFNRVKRQELARLRLIDPTIRKICEGAIDDLVDFERIISYKEFGDNIRRATMDDIRQICFRLKPENRWTLIVRP